MKLERSKLKARNRYKASVSQVRKLIILPVIIVLGALFFLYSISYADRTASLKGSSENEAPKNDVLDVSYTDSGAKEVRFHKTLPTAKGFISVGTCYTSDELKYQLLVVFFDSNFVEQWRFEFGDTGDEWAFDVVEDEGYIIVGVTGSKKYGVRGRYDVVVLKLDYAGKLQWYRLYSGPDWDRAYKIVKMPTGYALAGDNYLKGFDVSTNFGEHDFWLVAIDKNGNKLWDRSFGGLKWDRAYALTFVDDRNLLVVGGSSNSFSDGKRYDSYIVAYDLSGNLVWRLPLVIKNGSVWVTDLRTASGSIYAAGYVVEFVADGGRTNGVRPVERGFLAKITSAGKLEYFRVFGQDIRLHAFDLLEKSETHETFAVAGYKDVSGSKRPWLASVTIDVQGEISQNTVPTEMNYENNYGMFFDVQVVRNPKSLILSGKKLVNGKFVGILRRITF
ncbi:hypothetical protein [Fervidobacterium thailandense]|uniref:Uncharacterized protein n=1 Tax=Fervidobacterium thailandense TaxID=1008305 RepID=A0A1E3G525_9BACT|nr:hypothetical protein [Fervidobacterium thailandense]ODN31396.1 hypothetical protein A4H02_01165 [Fervidobacterium thailandense]